MAAAATLWLLAALGLAGGARAAAPPSASPSGPAPSAAPSASPTPPPSASPREPLAAVREELLTGQYAEAERRLRERLALSTAAADPERRAELLALHAQLLRETGRCAEAEAAAREALRLAPAPAGALELARTLAATGRYAEAGRTLEEAEARGAGLGLLRGERLVLLDGLGEHEAAGKLRDYFYATYRLSWSRDRQRVRVYAADVPPATPGGRPAEREVTAPEELVALARAVRRENPKRAFVLLEALRRQQPRAVAAALESGDLAYEKYAWGRARQAFEAALALNPRSVAAHVGLGELFLVNAGYAEAEAEARKALAVNPHCVAAHCLLAALRETEMRPADALPAIEEALAVNPNSLEALALLAAHHLGCGDATRLEEAVARAKVVAPRSGFIFTALGEAAERKRLFERAVEFGRQASAIDASDWKGYYLSGSNLLRLGEEQAGHQLLERAFQLNDYNVWCLNLLNVIDQLFDPKKYARLETEHFVLRVPESEAPVYLALAAGELEVLYAELKQRYQYQPHGPQECGGKILVEFLHSHDAFSARTVGLPGLGALGASFGPVITMPTPRFGVQSGHFFSWREVLRHELAHVFTLQLTDGRIPRWLTEGFSLCEEREPMIGAEPLLEHALAAGELRPLTQLENLFLRPKSQQDLGLAYYEGELLVQHLLDTYGFEKLRATLPLYRQGKSDREALEATLGRTLEELERETTEALETYVRKIPLVLPPEDAEMQRLGREFAAPPATPDPAAAAAAARRRARLALGYAARGDAPRARVEADLALKLDAHCALAHDLIGKLALDQQRLPDAVAAFRRGLAADPNDFSCRMHLGLALLAQKKPDEAAPELESARALYPRAFFNPNPYQLLVQLYLADGGEKNPEKRRKALAVLADAVRYNRNEFGAAKKLAELRLERQEYAEAFAATRSAVYVNPFDAATRRMGGKAAEALKRFPEAETEFRAAVDLEQQNLEALLGLARVLAAQKKNLEARKLVGQALAVDGQNAEARALAKQLGGATSATPSATPSGSPRP